MNIGQRGPKTLSSVIAAVTSGKFRTVIAKEPARAGADYAPTAPKYAHKSPPKHGSAIRIWP